MFQPNALSPAPSVSAWTTPIAPCVPALLIFSPAPQLLLLLNTGILISMRRRIRFCRRPHRYYSWRRLFEAPLFQNPRFTPVQPLPAVALASTSGAEIVPSGAAALSGANRLKYKQTH